MKILLGIGFVLLAVGVFALLAFEFTLNVPPWEDDPDD